MSTPPPHENLGPTLPDVEEDVEILLADARARAHDLIEQSVQRAQELLRERRAVEPLGLDRLRRTVGDLALDVRAIHQRLDGLEALLRTLVAERPLPQGAQPTHVAPAPAASEPPPPVAAPPASAARPAAPPPPPPPRAEAPAPVIATNGSAARGTVFSAAIGSIVLRVSPVAGFQGLMRVQDALAHVPGVREAGVEAYAQGEARLRLQLAEDVASERIAAALAEHLGRPARVAAASVADRSMQLALE